jgi:predicted Zn-dependent peptidase
MVFKGTRRLLSGEFEQHIEGRGAVTNAATSQDYTQYYITTAPQDFADLVPLQIDVVLHASIPDVAFEQERLVVLEEIRRAEDNPRRRTFQNVMEVAFEQLPYRRPVLGPTSVIEQLTPQQMRDFHAGWYQPNSITAVAVGNLPVEQLIQQVIAGFDESYPVRNAPRTLLDLSVESGIHSSQRSSQQLPPSATVMPEPSFSTLVRREVVDPSLQQARLVLLWRVPGLTELSQTYGLDVLASILGQGRTSRLVQDLRENRRLVSAIVSSNLGYLTQGIFYVTAQLPSEHLEAAEAAIVQQIQRLQTELISTAEINRVRTQVANRFVFSNETPSDRANLYGYYYSQLGSLEPALNYPTQIQALDPVDLQRSAQQYLSADAYGVVILRPDSPEC